MQWNSSIMRDLLHSLIGHSLVSPTSHVSPLPSCPFWGGSLTRNSPLDLRNLSHQKQFQTDTFSWKVSVLRKKLLVKKFPSGSNSDWVQRAWGRVCRKGWGQDWVWGDSDRRGLAEGCVSQQSTAVCIKRNAYDFCVYRCLVACVIANFNV